MTAPAALDRLLSGIVLVTGTGTGVGKTMVTAALAHRALAAGRRVSVVKPVQTAGASEPGDIAEVHRLLGRSPSGVHGNRLELHELTRLPHPLAPQAAARLAGRTLPPLSAHAERIAQLAANSDLVLIEGAGGVLVRLDGVDARGGTIADLAPLLLGRGCRPVGALVVTGAELGTLNVTELTVEALSRREVSVLGLLIGSWPADPGPAELSNLDDLPALTGVPLLGAVPRGAAPPPPVLDIDRLAGPLRSRAGITVPVHPTA